MAGFVVGITGGIASGKSAVCELFARAGVVVADADVAARAVVGPGSAALARIAAEFGPGLLLAGGELDRARLRQLVFADAAARARLEAITHPLIRAQLEHECAAAPGPYALAAIPLLAESRAQGQAHYRWLRRVLVVDCPQALQKTRLLSRPGIDADIAQAMIAAQASRASRLALADDVLVNDGSLAELEAPVARLHARYLRLAGSQA